MHTRPTRWRRRRGSERRGRDRAERQGGGTTRTRLVPTLRRGERWGAPMRAGLTLHEHLELALAQVEVIMGANDPHPEMAQGELTTLLQIVGVVEPHAVAAVDERHPTGPDHLADVTAHDQRGILVDPQAKQFRVTGNDHEQP